MSDIALQIAVLSTTVNADLPLADRIKSAMRYVRAHEDKVFWMSLRVDDDMRMRTALGAVLTKCNDDERYVIERSLKPLRMLAAAAQGIPVDFGQFEMADDLLPILGMWHETEAKP